jgi:LacI family transcriptional regulator
MRDPRVPKYLEVSRAIESQIKGGLLVDGRVPSIRQIAQQKSVSIVTAARAVRLLEKQGLVRTVERSGCFVTNGKERGSERWALCQRVTSGPWHQASSSLFKHSFEVAGRQRGTLIRSDLFDYRDDTDEVDMHHQVRRALQEGTTGAFFLPARISEAAMRRDEAFLSICRAEKLPVVLLERNLRGTGRTLEWDLVASDDVQGGYCVTRHLLDIGRRRIAFATGSPCSSHDNRASGYVMALRQSEPSLADWQPTVLPQPAGPGDKDTFRDLADRVFDLRLDAVICYEDYTAMGLILELLTRGTRVPDDVAVAGFDDLPIGSFFSVGVTTYALAVDEITRQAFRIMGERLKEPGQAPVMVAVPGKLIVRESTAGALLTPGTSIECAQ